MLHKNLVLVVGLLAALATQGGEAPLLHRTRISRCGISLSVIKGSVTRQVAVAESPCQFGIVPPGWSRARRQAAFELPETAIDVAVYAAPLKTVAEEHGFMSVAELRRRLDEPSMCKGLPPDAFVVQGGRGTPECEQAIPIAGKQFAGIRGEASYGRMRKHTGAYVGLGTQCFAAVSSGSTTVYFEGTEGYCEDEFSHLVNSISKP